MKTGAHTLRRSPAVAAPVIGKTSLAIGAFLTGFVINEPAPYELFMAVLVPIWFLFGLRISANSAFLLVLLVLFNVGGLLSMTTMSDIDSNATLYIAVSLFLALTAVFFAAVIEDDASRLPVIFNAYLAGALITALLGILGYFDAFPGADVFTRYDRAMGAFQDPNVFGPFLVLPCCFLIYRMLTGPLSAMPWRLLALGILSFGVFLSFSRAAWGLYVICTAFVVFMLLLKERSQRLRLRIFLIATFGFTLIVLSVLIALQVDHVADLFSTRAQLQDYDTALFGRFARYGLGFDLAAQRPFGIGPLVFSHLYGEDTHNIWLKALLDYGWLGFVAFLSLTLWTAAIGFRCLLRQRAWQPYLVCTYAVFVGHILMATFIDIDHWRHFYIMLGIIWGCVGLEQRYQRKRRGVT